MVCRVLSVVAAGEPPGIAPPDRRPIWLLERLIICRARRVRDQSAEAFRLALPAVPAVDDTIEVRKQELLGLACLVLPGAQLLELDAQQRQLAPRGRHRIGRIGRRWRRNDAHRGKNVGSGGLTRHAYRLPQYGLPRVNKTCPVVDGLAVIPRGSGRSSSRRRLNSSRRGPHAWRKLASTQTSDTSYPLAQHQVVKSQSTARAPATMSRQHTPSPSSTPPIRRATTSGSRWTASRSTTGSCANQH